MSNFKVGDWIKIGDTVQQITAINPENDYNITCDMVETTDDYVSIESIEPWYPKEGEWCWFYNRHTEVPLLRRFEYIFNGRFYTNDEIMFDICEPFIGELPSFLKDKQ